MAYPHSYQEIYLQRVPFSIAMLDYRSVPCFLFFLLTQHQSSSKCQHSLTTWGERRCSSIVQSQVQQRSWDLPPERSRQHMEDTDPPEKKKKSGGKRAKWLLLMFLAGGCYVCLVFKNHTVLVSYITLKRICFGIFSFIASYQGCLIHVFSCLQFYGKEAWIAYTTSTVKTSVVILSFGLVEPFQPNEMFIYVW